MQFWLTFHGGAGTVTGANFLLERMDPPVREHTQTGAGGQADADGSSILIDCGLVQGERFCDDCNRQPFQYDPKSVDTLFVTHAHADHIGRIPFLVREGFRGRIISTPETRDLAELMLADSLDIMREESARAGEVPLFDKADIARAFELWRTYPYHERIDVGGLSARLLDAGHILGSAMVELTGDGGRKIVFTGDLGNSPAPLLNPIEKLSDVTYLVMESVYGDRLHEDAAQRTEQLRRAVERAIEKQGVLMIPAFSIERTQTLLYELNNLVESGVVPRIPVYLDSPLAIRVTKVYRRYIQNLGKNVREALQAGDDIFKFPGLEFTEGVEASKEIFKTPTPKIIIAGAGMSHGGRILHHEKRYLPDPNTTLLLVGYQVPGSLGRRLQDGAKEVRIFDKPVPVRAHIETIRGYSSHCDRDCLLDVVAGTAETLENVFVTMGEPKSSLSLVQRIRDFLDVSAVAPKQGESVELEL